MSLLGALQLGKTSLTAAQAGLQTAGNNISNANTAGYTRQTVRIVSNTPESIATGLQVGTGATVKSVDRMVSEALQASLRTATSDASRADTYSSYMSRLETTYNAVGANDLGDRMTSFFNEISTLSNNATDTAQAGVVVQSATSLASYIQDLRTRTMNIRTDVETQISQLAKQANTLLQNVAALNVKIANTEGSGGSANALRDQRDQALNDLSEIVDVTSIEQPNGMVNVLIGSTPAVQGGASRGITTKLETSENGQYTVTKVMFADSDDLVSIGSGKIAALQEFRDNDIEGSLKNLDASASALINTVNAISSQGQGLVGFSKLTSTEAVNSNTTALNALTPMPPETTVLPSTPKNGSFTISEKNLTTGEITSRQIEINFDGSSPTTLNSLAASITGGSLTATANANGTLSIKSNDTNVSFSFSDDSSGVLAALGINTIFSGKDSRNIGVNPALTDNPKLLASGRNNTEGDNSNAQAMVLAYDADNASLGGVSLKQFYINYIGEMSSTASAANEESTAQSAILSSVTTQRESYSGVNTDEETVNLLNYQRMYQGTAKYISIVNGLLDTVLNLVK